jgi:hypothetical protein
LLNTKFWEEENKDPSLKRIQRKHGPPVFQLPYHEIINFHCLKLPRLCHFEASQEALRNSYSKQNRYYLPDILILEEYIL